ncbi:MAG: hypothetical protein LAO20_07910 [Acidobacteriia bacterium]|nr:hypothetical protein [Terriglobia bacterium]
MSKQFFAFVEANPILESVISELVARNPQSVQEVGTAPRGSQIYGETAEQAAAIAYTKWKAYAAQEKMQEFYNHVHTSDGFEAGLDKYRDWYVEPLFDYLDEVLEDANVILLTLIRYKHKVEWYRREELQKLFEANSSQGEKVLAKNMYEYLFDQGIPFHVEPQTASGRPDVVSLEDSDHPFIGDYKVFDAAGRGATYIKKGLYQVHQYCCDYNESVGYLIVFNVSNKQLRLELPSSGDGVPCFEYGHKTVFITVVDIHAHEVSASCRGIPETVTISADELIREMKEQEQKQSVEASE